MAIAFYGLMYAIRIEQHAGVLIRNVQLNEEILTTAHVKAARVAEKM